MLWPHNVQIISVFSCLYVLDCVLARYAPCLQATLILDHELLSSRKRCSAFQIKKQIRPGLLLLSQRAGTRIVRFHCRPFCTRFLFPIILMNTEEKTIFLPILIAPTSRGHYSTHSRGLRKNVDSMICIFTASAILLPQSVFVPDSMSKWLARFSDMQAFHLR